MTVREDGGTTQSAFRRASYSASLRSSRPRFSHRDPTPYDVRQSHAQCLLCDDSALCPRTVSLPAPVYPTPVYGLPWRLRTRTFRPSQLPCVGGEPPSPASAVSTVCSGLGRPSAACLATRREARPRCVPTDFCFPHLDYEYPRLVVSRHLSEACASPLNVGLHPRPKDRRTWRFTTPGPLQRARPGWCAAFFFRKLPSEPSLWHPCRLPIRRGCAFARAVVSWGRRDQRSDPP